jgi:two-component system chemotaxis sensor kinase CheA
MDMEQLRSAAQREGLRTQKQLADMDDSQLLQLAFTSGISTSAEVSTVSGRGLGLAIVEQKVKQLGGSVTAETHAGLGTVFRIHVPATLATARGILAQVSDRIFVLPVVGVDRVVQIHRDDVRTVENRETIQIEGRTLPLVSLHEVLELPRKPQRDHSEHVQALVVGSDDERVAFAVDRVLEEQEVLVRTLGPQLLRVRNIAGATVIGSGQVVPILNVVDLLHSAATRPMPGRRATVDRGDEAAKKAVLVVEDSITSRMLLKNVLEAAGYYARPTVDGVDALAALQEEEFDLVVSDIEMPRMDGFELTKKIRGDQRSARMPVVLVTALESQTDRERGLDAGANAYLPKSSFTQGTLLKTVRSLM